jgi:hypothetical protein
MTRENITGLHCCDCGGWPIENGARFLCVVFVKDEKKHEEYVCELCYLKRLYQRGDFCNRSSSPGSQLTVPELGLWRDGDRTQLEKMSGDLIDAMLALQMALGIGWMNETMRRRAADYTERFKVGVPEKYRDKLTVE